MRTTPLSPRRSPDEKIAVLIDVLNYNLQPKQQAIAYDAGYFYPGPAVKDVTIEMAPQESQDTIKEFGWPEYADWIANKSAGSAARAEAARRSLPDMGRKDRLQEGLIQPVAGAGCDSRCRPDPS